MVFPTNICYSCLSSDRILVKIGRYKELFYRIALEIGNVNALPDEPQLCWECIGLLQKITRFQQRAQKAHRFYSLMQSEQMQIQPFDSLSTFQACHKIGFDVEINIFDSAEPSEFNDDVVEVEIELSPLNSDDDSVFFDDLRVMPDHVIKEEDDKEVLVKEEIDVQNMDDVHEIPKPLTKEHSPMVLRKRKIKECNDIIVKKENENMQGNSSKRARKIKSELSKEFSIKLENEESKENVYVLIEDLKRNKKTHKIKVQTEIKYKRCTKNILANSKVKKPIKKKSKRIEKQKFANNYTCGHCSEVFRDSTNLVDHVASTHVFKLSEVTVEYADSVQSDTSIPPIIKVTGSHKRQSDKKCFPCPSCNESFERRGNLKNHYDKVHDQKGVYCAMCKKYFIDLLEFRKHKSDMHPELCKAPLKKDKICQYCGNGFSQLSKLIDHIHTHTGERPFHCGLCPRRFIQKVSLIKHTWTVHGLRISYSDIPNPDSLFKVESE